MSECVVLMEMPSNCFDCILHCDGSFADENGYCLGVPPYMDYDCRPSGEMRPSWCPIICQLPEGHGRLVDMRDIESMMEDAQSTSDESGMYSLVYRDDLDFEKLHTIVPAEIESPSPKPTDPVPVRDVYYVMTECDVKSEIATYELRERSEP